MPFSNETSPQLFASVPTPPVSNKILIQKTESKNRLWFRQIGNDIYYIRYPDQAQTIITLIKCLKTGGFYRFALENQGNSAKKQKFLGNQLSSIRFRSSISSESEMSSARNLSICRTACITVVWSRPPNLRPISGNDRLVSCFARYMAT